MKVLTSILVLFLGQGISSLAFAFPDFEKSCETAKKFENDPNPQYRINILDWTKASIQDMGYKDFIQQENSLSLEVGHRSVILAVEGDVASCRVVGGMLRTLKRFKDHGLDQKINGMVFIFSRLPASGGLGDGYKKLVKNRVVLKEYVVTEDNAGQIGSQSKDWYNVDQNPSKILGSAVTDFVKSFDKTPQDLKKVVSGDEVNKFQEGLKQMVLVSKKWGAEQYVVFQEKIKGQKATPAVKEKLSDLQKHIELYDEIRRGLWDRAQQTAGQIHFPSDKLKNEMGKGRQNIDGILKAIKADTQNIEKDIKTSFDENKKFVQDELAGSSHP